MEATWDEMPVDMGKLVAQQLVVDLVGSVLLRKHLAHRRDLFDEAAPFLLGQEKQFGRMTLEHEHRPALEKLVFMEVSDGQPAVRDTQMRGRPGAQAGGAVRLVH